MNSHLKHGPERLLEPLKVQQWKDEQIHKHKQISTILKGQVAIPRINPPALPNYDHDMSYVYIAWHNLQVRMEKQDPSIKKPAKFGSSIFT